jgi:transcriptional regulator with XRE-family HTH domain
VPTQRPPQAARKSGIEIDPKRRLGLRIKELRGKFVLTQEELADRSGLFRTYMSRIESGQANPTLTMLYQIASAFPVDVSELFAPVKGEVPPRVKSLATVSRGRAGR